MTVEYEETIPVTQIADRLNEVVEMIQKNNAKPRITILNCDGMTSDYEETMLVIPTADRLNNAAEITSKETVIPRIMISNCEGIDEIFWAKVRHQSDCRS